MIPHSLHWDTKSEVGTTCLGVYAPPVQVRKSHYPIHCPMPCPGQRPFQDPLEGAACDYGDWERAHQTPILDLPLSMTPAHTLYSMSSVPSFANAPTSPIQQHVNTCTATSFQDFAITTLPTPSPSLAGAGSLLPWSSNDSPISCGQPAKASSFYAEQTMGICDIWVGFWP